MRSRQELLERLGEAVAEMTDDELAGLVEDLEELRAVEKMDE
jgi:hypothetical protein